MTRPFISVLIDTYNHERFIEHAIVSVIGQDFPASDREILVVDDGSTDSTPEIIRKFAPHVRLLRKVNGGQATAFNAGIPECKGQIVAFLDGDDWWEPQKLSVVAAEFESHPQNGTVGHGIFEVDETGKRLNQIAPDRTYESHLSNREEGHEFLPLRAFLGTSRLSVRRSVLDRIIPLPASLQVEADEFLAAVATALGGTRVLHQPLTNYRLHSGNLFQFASWDTEKAKRKYGSLATIARELPARLAAAGIADEVAEILTNSVNLDAVRLRLSMGEGWSWETVKAEREAYRQSYRHATFGYRIFHLVVLGIATALPPRVFYKLRQWYTARGLARVRRLVGEATPVTSLAVRKV
ncbi:MAG TPA: glycosyltransferase [Candidatus Acidoferrum sp.]|nr:glycosyltransferase [Candidatus Acidoferrum sp.]